MARCPAGECTLVKTPPGPKGAVVEHCSKCGAQPFDWGKCRAAPDGQHKFHDEGGFRKLHPPVKMVVCEFCHEEVEWPPPEVQAMTHPTHNTVAPHFDTVRTKLGRQPLPAVDHSAAFRAEMAAHRAKAAARASAEKPPVDHTPIGKKPPKARRP